MATPFRWLVLGLSSLVVILRGAGGAAAETPPVPETVAEGAKLAVAYHAEDWFFEGPTWDPHGRKLYFTAFGMGQSQILRLDAPGRVVVWMDKTQGVNGTDLSRDGRLLGAQYMTHRIVSLGLGPEGPTDPKVLYANPKLNQPNDVC